MVSSLRGGSVAWGRAAGEVGRRDALALLGKAVIGSGTPAELAQVLALAQTPDDAVQLEAIIAAESNRWEQVKAILEAAPAGDRGTIGDLMLRYLSRSAVSDVSIINPRTPVGLVASGFQCDSWKPRAARRRQSMLVTSCASWKVLRYWGNTDSRRSRNADTSPCVRRWI